MNNAANRYDKVSIWLHWSIGIAIISIAAIEILRGELFSKGSILRETLKALHDPAGTVAFALIIVRLPGARLMRRRGCPKTCVRGKSSQPSSLIMLFMR